MMNTKDELAISLLGAIKKWRERYEQMKTEAGGKGELSKEASDVLLFASKLWNAVGRPRDLRMVKKADLMAAVEPSNQAPQQDPFEYCPF